MLPQYCWDRPRYVYSFGRFNGISWWLNYRLIKFANLEHHVVVRASSRGCATGKLESWDYSEDTLFLTAVGQSIYHPYGKAKKTTEPPIPVRFELKLQMPSWGLGTIWARVTTFAGEEWVSLDTRSKRRSVAVFIKNERDANAAPCTEQQSHCGTYSA